MRSSKSSISATRGHAEARGRRTQGTHPTAVLDGEAIACDLVVTAGGHQPAYSLLAQAGARIEYDAQLGVFVPTQVPPGIEVVGGVTGEGLSSIASEPAYGAGKCFVCVCEDVTTKDLRRANGKASTRSSSPSGTRP